MSTRLPTLFGSPKIDILTNRKDYYSLVRNYTNCVKVFKNNNINYNIKQTVSYYGKQ